MYACLRKNVDMAKLLLDNGAEINLRDYDKWTALMYASYFGQEKLVELFLKYGAKTKVS